MFIPTEKTSFCRLQSTRVHLHPSSPLLFNQQFFKNADSAVILPFFSERKLPHGKENSSVVPIGEIKMVQNGKIIKNKDTKTVLKTEGSSIA